MGAGLRDVKFGEERDGGAAEETGRHVESLQPTVMAARPPRAVAAGTRGYTPARAHRRGSRDPWSIGRQGPEAARSPACGGASLPRLPPWRVA
jgi:hypothetical protein